MVPSSSPPAGVRQDQRSREIQPQHNYDPATRSNSSSAASRKRQDSASPTPKFELEGRRVRPSPRVETGMDDRPSTSHRSHSLNIHATSTADSRRTDDHHLPKDHTSQPPADSSVENRSRHNGNQDRTPSPATRMSSSRHRHTDKYRSSTTSPARSPLNRSMSVPSPSSKSTASSVVTIEPRSEEERFEKWRVNLERIVSSPTRTGNTGAERQEEKDHAHDPPSQQPHLKQSPQSTPTSSPPRVRKATAATAPAVPGTKPIAKSLATLHKKTRPTTAGTTTSHPSHPPPTRNHAAAFDRLYHGLSAVDPKAAAAAEPHPLRNSVEHLEASFLARLSKLVPEAEVVKDILEPGVSGSARARSKERAADSKSRPKARPSTASSSTILSEEDSLRARASQLKADLAALAVKKQQQHLAQAVANLRITARSHLEQAESILRQQVDTKMRRLNDERENATRSCQTLQRDLEEKIAALQSMVSQVSLRQQQVDISYEQAIVEVKREYELDLDSENEHVVKEMDIRIKELETGYSSHTTSASSSSSVVTSSHPAVVLPVTQHSTPWDSKPHANGTRMTSEDR